MAGQVMHHLAAARRMTNMNSILQIEMSNNSGQVIGIVIHIMTVGGLSGTSVPATVMGNHTIAAIEEEQHLRVPVIGRQRPSVAKYNRLTRTPILVEDLNAILGCDSGHIRSFGEVWLTFAN